MFRNYLTVALRNLVRHKLYSVITIAGLAVGLACAAFIILFVRNELSYDRWLPDTDHLYRLDNTVHAPGRPPQDFGTTPFMLAPTMRDEIPGVVAATRLNTEYMTFNVGAKQFAETVRSVDPNFLTVLHLPMVMGDPAQVLAQPQSVVLSQAMARKYFGDADPVGQIMAVSPPGCVRDAATCSTDPIALTVTGVFKDIPPDSQLNADFLLPYTSTADTFQQVDRQNWLEENTFSYVRLAPGADPGAILAKLRPILDRQVGVELAKFDIHIHAVGSEVSSVHLIPFRSVHLDGASAANITPAGSWATVYGVIAIGVLIMLMACFNFMNLATAQAMLRAQEIGVRKTLGARRSQLVAQFLGEAVLMAVLALVLALALVEVLLPRFDSFLHDPIHFSYLADWPVLALIAAVAVIAGLLSGVYPALVLSGFRPTAAMRGGARGHSGSGLLRSALVVVQFAVSITLGIATLVVFSQIDHARRAELGFRHDHVVILYAGPINVAARESLRRQLAAYPGIEAVAQSNDIPFSTNQSLDIVNLPGKADIVTLNETNIGPGYRALYDIPLIAGRDLMQDRLEDQRAPDVAPALNDGHSVVLNAAAVAHLGLTPQQIVGRTLIANNSHMIVVGVIGDAKFHGAREQAKPTLYYYYPYYAQVFSLRVRSEGMPETLAYIDRAWHAFSPTTAVSRKFLDDDFQTLYSADERQGQMFGVFVGLAIFIAALGLFGLAAFTAGRRTREIGLRKVFGARTSDVILLLLRQFSIPVALANLIAWPAAWLFLHGWLEGFADRISLSPVYFLSVGAAALVIAWATIFVHTLRVARANPIRALRYE